MKQDGGCVTPKELGLRRICWRSATTPTSLLDGSCLVGYRSWWGFFSPSEPERIKASRHKALRAPSRISRDRYRAGWEGRSLHREYVSANADSQDLQLIMLVMDWRGGRSLCWGI